MDDSHWSQLPVSMVASATKTETSSTTLGEVFEGIRTGKWEEPVKRVRERYAKAFKVAEEKGTLDPAAAAKEAVNKLKRDLPAVIPSGIFSKRADSAIEAHSGYICVDADNCAEPAVIRARLADDPCVQAAFVSPTGTGCKALVRIPADADTHERSFAAARKHFKEAHGIAIDEACKNLSRLCFVAHDADVFIRDEVAKVLEPLEPEAQAPETNGDYDSLPRPCYRLYHTSWHDGTKRHRPGVWFHNRRLTKKGEIVDTDQWICAPLEILARTTVRGDLEHGRLIEFTSTSGHKKRHILPMRLFAGRGDEALGELLSLGLATSRKLQSHILEHIQGLSPQEYYAAALSTGWHGEDVFVLPDEIIAVENHPEKVCSTGTRPGIALRQGRDAFRVAGQHRLARCREPLFNRSNLRRICRAAAIQVQRPWRHGPLSWAVHDWKNNLSFWGCFGLGWRRERWQKRVCPNLAEHGGWDRGLCQSA